MIELTGVTHRYSDDETTPPVLMGVGLSIRKGEFVAIVGKSGSGKSTLLAILLGILRPTGGEVSVLGRPPTLGTNETGVVLQDSLLLEDASVLENIALPLLNRGLGEERILTESRKRMEQVNLPSTLEHIPARKLSGGERKRVEIARAVVQKPRILVLDEPTGRLDSKNSRKLISLLKDLHDKLRMTVVMVTHDETLLDGEMRVVALESGKVSEDRIGERSADMGEELDLYEN